MDQNIDNDESNKAIKSVVQEQVVVYKMSDIPNNKEWFKSEIEELIKIYKSKPCLWDINSKEFKDKKLKNRALAEIACIFNTTVEQIVRKIHNLRNQFNRELKKTSELSTEDGDVEIYVSKWPYFKSLIFLAPVLTFRRSSGFMDAPVKFDLIDHNSSTRSEEIEGDETTHMEKDDNLEPQPKKKRLIIPVFNNPEGISAFHNSETVPIFNHGQNLPSVNPVCSSALIKARQMQNKSDDPYEIFGSFVASEMKSLSSDYLRRKLKRQIQKIILDIAEEDDRLQFHES